jgi:hypothetical protein
MDIETIALPPPPSPQDVDVDEDFLSILMSFATQLDEESPAIVPPPPPPSMSFASKPAIVKLLIPQLLRLEKQTTRLAPRDVFDEVKDRPEDFMGEFGVTVEEALFLNSLMR